jgi:hypothetical protein
MAWKSVATTSSANLSNKVYMWKIGNFGPITMWFYVSADAATTVDGSNYITEQAYKDVLGFGDLIWAYQVASIDDTRSIEDDMKAGITDISLHAVLENTGSVVDLSNDLLAATVTYGD